MSINGIGDHGYCCLALRWLFAVLRHVSLRYSPFVSQIKLIENITQLHSNLGLVYRSNLLEMNRVQHRAVYLLASSTTRHIHCDHVVSLTRVSINTPTELTDKHIISKITLLKPQTKLICWIYRATISSINLMYSCQYHICVHVITAWRQWTSQIERPRRF